MKSSNLTTYIQILAFFLLSFAGSGQNDREVKVGPKDWVSVETEIQAILDKQVECWNLQDIECFTHFYADLSYSCIMGVEGPICGRQNITKVYKQSYPKDKMGILKFGELQIRVLNKEVALCRGKFELSYPDKENASGWFTLVFEKLDEGWRIVSDHTT